MHIEIILISSIQNTYAYLFKLLKLNSRRNYESTVVSSIRSNGIFAITIIRSVSIGSNKIPVQNVNV